MTSKAYVAFDFPRNSLAIYLAESDGRRTVAVGEPVQLVMRTLKPEEVGTCWEPTLRLPEDMARALLDALAAHFGGTSEVQTLRKDYVAERARVDKVLDYLTSSQATAS